MEKTFSFKANSRNKISVYYNTNEDDMIKVEKSSYDNDNGIIYLSVEEALELQQMLSKATIGLSK